MSDGQKLLCITPFLHGKKHGLQKVYYVFKNHERLPDGVYLWKHTNFYQGKKHGQEIVFGDNEDINCLYNYHFRHTNYSIFLHRSNLKNNSQKDYQYLG